MAKKKAKGSNKFSNYIDMFSQVISGFIEQRLKVKQRVEDVKNNVLDALFGLKKQIMRGIVEAFLLITGIAALVVGSIMFLSRYIEFDILLIAYGVIISFGILFIAKLKRD
ncbi:hypothetical protein KY342_03070 [Candidatus Woesearchaeota archaeon]|nr:hypothetical protein [Candidatus Woesearchaeota archaeon]